MSALPSPQAIVDANRAAGLTVVEVRSWRTHNRNASGSGPMTNCIGIANHHTGGETSDPYGYAAGILYDGYSGLLGPLCDSFTGRDAKLYLVGYGTANHAGLCAANTITLLRADAMPLDREMSPGPDAVNANPLTWGVENQGNTWITPFSPAHYQTIVTHSAVMCMLFGAGWSGGSVTAHKGLTTRKPRDPANDMAAFRRAVNARIGGPIQSTGGKGMICVGQQERGIWLLDAGYAYHLDGEQWGQVLAWWVSKGLVPYVEVSPGGAGPAAFDRLVQSVTANPPRGLAELQAGQHKPFYPQDDIETLRKAGFVYEGNGFASLRAAVLDAHHTPATLTVPTDDPLPPGATDEGSGIESVERERRAGAARGIDNP